MPALHKITPLRQYDTCRLIPSRFADVEDSVLAPLAVMLGGGLLAMQTVRQLLDARRGGL